MSSKVRSARLIVVAAVGVAAIVAALVAARIAPAAGTAHAASAHSCLVMTGSGDPAFVRNFNPYTAQGLPSGQFVRGAVYEGLIVTPAGGLPARPWLARSWKWSNGNKTLTLNLAPNAKWSDGKPLTVRRRRLQPQGRHGRQSPVMDVLGYSRPDTNVASIKAAGLAHGRDQAEDVRLAVHLVVAELACSSSRSTSGRR